jgi:hypothetical protein
LKQKVGEYEGLTVEWIGGHEPEAWLYSGPEESDFVEKFSVPDANADELAKLFAEKGFVFKQKLQVLPAPLQTSSFQGKEYRLYPELYAWETLPKLVIPPARVLRVESAEEDAFLRSWLEEGKHYWLGASDASAEGVWTWEGESTPFWTKDGVVEGAFSGWAEGEPNNSNPSGPENCALFAGGGGWVDRPCSEQHQLVVETPVDSAAHSQEL